MPLWGDISNSLWGKASTQREFNNYFLFGEIPISLWGKRLLSLGRINGSLWGNDHCPLGKHLWFSLGKLLALFGDLFGERFGELSRQLLEHIFFYLCFCALFWLFSNPQCCFCIEIFTTCKTCFQIGVHTVKIRRFVSTCSMLVVFRFEKGVDCLKNKLNHHADKVHFVEGRRLNFNVLHHWGNSY